MTDVFKNNRWLLILVVFFILTRIFGLGQLYHQDEYRWASIANTAEFGELESPHPPMAKFLFTLAGKVFGYDNLRLVPFLISIVILLLIYVVSFQVSGSKTMASIAASLLAVNTYGLIANLQIDIDGAILPLFVLLAYYFYLRFSTDGNKKFLLPLVLAMAAGFLTKLSYILFAGALAVEYLWILYNNGKLKHEIKRTGLWLGFSGILIVLFYLLYGKEDPRFAEYSTNFRYLNFASRSYFDLFLRLFKFFIWLSPLLFLPMVYGFFKKEIFVKYRIWYIYTLFNLLFYLVIFDFTRLPIERYFMFIIIPAVLVGADVINSFLPKINRKALILACVGFAVFLAVILLISQDVIPLNPKEAYIDKIRNFDLNFLIPQTGGSGPIGFYVSAQFVFWTWLVCAAWLFINKNKWALSLFLVFGIGYNLLLSTENLTGIMYGNVDSVTKKSLGYVIKNPNIEKVITYYDIGAYNLILADKYEARFYTAPTRDYTARLTAFRGHYLIIDFPAIDKNGLYWKLISRCKLDKKFTDKYVDSYIFDCRSLPSVDK